MCSCKAKNLEQLIADVKQFWSSVTPEGISKKYRLRLQKLKVLPQATRYSLDFFKYVMYFCLNSYMYIALHALALQ